MRMEQHAFGLILRERIMHFNKLMMDEHGSDYTTILAAIKDVMQGDFRELLLDMMQGRLEEQARRERVRKAYPREVLIVYDTDEAAKGADIVYETGTGINIGQPPPFQRWNPDDELPPHS